MSDLMPKPTEPIAGPGGLITRSWRDYLRRFAAATALAEVWAAIEDIRAQLANSGAGSFLASTTQVTGRNSVQTFGTLADGVVLVQLQGDEQNPATSSYYGTDADGARGFHGHALATLSDTDVVTNAPTAGEALLFDGTAWVPGEVATSGGFLPLTTGEISGDQPVFVYGPDGRLIYAPVT
jgi:hypothetical protein